MELFDTHAHLNFRDFDKDRKEVINRTLSGGVFALNAGSNYKTSKLGADLAKEQGKGMYAAVGLHPIHVTEEKFIKESYKDLAKRKGVVAIGETGLDYKFKESAKEQERVFLKHLELAQELNLPLIFHCRMAHKELIKILKTQMISRGATSGMSDFNLCGVVHCFTGNVTEAREYLNMGLYLGFNGIIFKLNLKKVIEETPIERILLETDCPFLTPPTRKGRNEPLSVKDIAEEIERIKG